MATVEQIDNKLIRDAIWQRLADIDDPLVLRAFLTLSDKYHKPKPLTPEQAEAFERGERQIAAGKWIFHEDFMKELDEEFGSDEG